MKKRLVVSPNKFRVNEAAKKYVQTLKTSPGRYDYLYQKPYSFSNHRSYFSYMHGIVNILQAMSVPPGGHVLDVGSGPGWITEILAGLGFRVTCIEPSEDMIEIAKKRIELFDAKHRLKSNISWKCEIIEECSLKDASCDGIIFFDALHHVVDESLSLKQCYRILTPGGVIGIYEGAWVPGNRDIEAPFIEETNRSGVLESPFTREYLDLLLRQTGFIQVNRYYVVNGLFLPSKNPVPFALDAMKYSNILTAVRPYPKTTADPTARTSAIIKPICSKNKGGKTVLKIELENTGDTAWLHREADRGWVTIALRKGEPGSPEFREMDRHHLPRTILPGERLEMDLEYPDLRNEEWTPDLVNEGYYWFSQKLEWVPKKPK